MKYTIQASKTGKSWSFISVERTENSITLTVVNEPDVSFVVLPLDKVDDLVHLLQKLRV